MLVSCQLQKEKPSSSLAVVIVEKDNCRIDDTKLYNLQSTETRFLENPSQRRKIMAEANKNKDSLLLALLLSTPLSSSKQLKQAEHYYSHLVLYPSHSCIGDNYFALRHQYTSALIWMRAEQDNLAAENSAQRKKIDVLRIKIDALTQIEKDLSEERKIQK